MTPLEAATLGLVQGLTEFLPISSTAHLKIIPALLGWGDPGAEFSAVIQLGTVAAVLVYFARDLGALTVAFLEGLRARQPFGTEQSRLAWFIGLGTIPIGLCGLTFKTAIKTSLRSLYVIAASLILLALVLAVVERLASRSRTLSGATLADAMWIGLWQVLALIPGSSRSGVTLTGALQRGFTRADAARFSFLLSIPATTLAGLLEFRDLLKAPSAPPLLQVAIGTTVAFASGMLAIAFLLRFLKTRSTLVFVVYRVALGALLLGLLSTGRLAP